MASPRQAGPRGLAQRRCLDGFQVEPKPRQASHDGDHRPPARTKRPMRTFWFALKCQTRFYTCTSRTDVINRPRGGRRRGQSCRISWELTYYRRPNNYPTNKTLPKNPADFVNRYYRNLSVVPGKGHPGEALAKNLPRHYDVDTDGEKTLR